MIRLREAVADILKETDWVKNNCMLCGSPPYMARLEKEGARTLACSVCGQEWRFQRLQCPFCETDDRTALAYLSADNDEGYRIDVCRQCKRYIKTVDSREREEVLPMELEDILTQHLDVVAQERGY
jgi:FdhE protein